MTDLVLVRHGETVWHPENRYAGSSDIELTERGRAQAQDLARWAGGAKLDALWCSVLRRSQETAMYCAETSGLQPRADPRLNELDFGYGEGLTAQEVRCRFPGEGRAFDADPVGHPLPGGEDPLAATARSIACITEIVEEVPLGRVLIVTHNTLIRLMLCHLLGIPLAEYRRRFPSIDNCAITEIRALPGSKWALLQYNASPARGDPSSQEHLDCLD